MSINRHSTDKIGRDLSQHLITYTIRLNLVALFHCSGGAKPAKWSNESRIVIMHRVPLAFRECRRGESHFLFYWIIGVAQQNQICTLIWFVELRIPTLLTCQRSIPPRAITDVFADVFIYRIILRPTKFIRNCSFPPIKTAFYTKHFKLDRIGNTVGRISAVAHTWSLQGNTHIS